MGAVDRRLRQVQGAHRRLADHQLVLYIMRGFGAYDDLLARLGKHKTGGGCLYINRLEDVDMAVLRQMAADSVAWMREKHGV